MDVAVVRNAVEILEVVAAVVTRALRVGEAAAVVQPRRGAAGRVGERRSLSIIRR